MPPNNPKSALSSQMARLRKQVDQIDQKLLQLLQERTRLSGEIGRTKRRHGAEIYVPDRERELLARVAKLADGKLPPAAAQAIFREILSSSRAAQGQPPIGLLAASAGQVEPIARGHFGSCDVFIATRDWPDMARRLLMGTLAIGLVNFGDLAAALGRRWRPGVHVIGEISQVVLDSDAPAQGPRSRGLHLRGDEGTLRNSIFILKPGTTPETGNRALILIECKPTADAVKSLVSDMPQPPNLVQLAPLAGRGKSCLAALTFERPVSRDAMAGKGALIGLYPAGDTYGG